jgi:enediyne biosynthesis protein E4
MDWVGHTRQRTTLALYHNNRNGTLTDVTKQAGLAIEMYGMGVAVGDFDNDGFPDLFITCVGQSRLFRNTGRGTFADVTKASGLDGREAFSTSAMWVDIDRDGHLDLVVCNYVRWSPERDVFCSLDGTQKSYCTPEAYRGETSWLFRNRGDGTFEDITATCGIFDSGSKALGVALLDDDQDGWPDILIANDTEPNKLYRNQRNGRFRDVALAAGVALSEDGKARAGMGVDAGDFDNSGRMGLAITNFEGEMMGLYRAEQAGRYRDVAVASGVGPASKNRLGFGCLFADVDLDGDLDLIVVNGHIDDTVRNIPGNVGYAQPPHLFLNDGGRFRDVASQAGGGFEQPRVGRGLAVADFDRDGDVDILLTTNNGPAALFRNDVAAGPHSVRLRLVGVQSNRDAIGANVRLTSGGVTQSRMVRSGSSYLSQSELPLTFGLGRRQTAERVVIMWPNGRVEEFTNVAAGAHQCVEGKGITDESR